MISSTTIENGSLAIEAFNGGQIIVVSLVGKLMVDVFPPEPQDFAIVAWIGSQRIPRRCLETTCCLESRDLGGFGDVGT